MPADLLIAAMYAYDAVAHPALSGGLLVLRCTNRAFLLGTSVSAHSVWSGFITTIASFTLVAGSLTSAGAAEAPASADASAVSVESLPAIASPEVEQAARSVPKGEFVVPVPAADDPASESKVADDVLADWERDRNFAPVSEREEMSTTFEPSPGSFVTEFSSAPVNARAADGSWREISTSVEDLGGGEWGATVHPLDPVFGESADEADVLSVSRDGHEVSVGLEGASETDRQTPFWWWDDHQKITYPDALGATDLTYEVTRGGVKETLVLESESGVSSWSWLIDAGDLTVRLGDVDVAEFVDAGGDVVMHIPAPWCGILQGRTN